MQLLFSYVSQIRTWARVVQYSDKFMRSIVLYYVHRTID